MLVIVIVLDRREPITTRSTSTSKKVPAEGIEPTHPCEYWILSPARLPVPPRRLCSSGSEATEKVLSLQATPSPNLGLATVANRLMIRHMKTSVFSALFILAVFVASESFAATPTVEITARQISNGKAVEKVTTDATGTFQLQALPAGHYTLEFRCRKSPDLKAKQFTLTIRGTRQIGTQGGIAGTSLVGGVALNVEVGPGATVVGQIATGVDAATAQTMYWQPQLLGSNIAGHWTTDKHRAPGYNIVNVPNDIFQKMQDETGAPIETK